VTVTVDRSEDVSRQSALALHRRRQYEDQLRAQLQAARAAGDKVAVARLCARLDNAYVQRGWRRALDPEVRRLRRLLAAA
jgi:hypothetical protein